MSNRGRHKNRKHPLVKLLGKTITDKMMYYQKEQGNIPKLETFIRFPRASSHANGFTWDRTEEGFHYWAEIIDKLETYLNNNRITYRV